MIKAKKWTAVFALLLLLCLFAGCSEDAPSGRYAFYSFSQDGVTYTAEDMRSLNLDVDLYIQFSEDGSGILSFGGEQMDFSWSENKLRAEGYELNFRFEADRVIVNYESAEIIFQK